MTKEILTEEEIRKQNFIPNNVELLEGIELGSIVSMKIGT